jgi:hypothetical protein
MQIRTLLLASLLLGAAPVSGAVDAVPPTSTDARAIMTAVERRDLGERMTARMQFDVDSKTGGKRLRLLQSRSTNVPGGRRQLLLFESPSDVRNVGLLTWDHDDGGKSDDQWLYLPALHKSSRITQSDRSGPFMGTDLSYSDMTRKDPSQYEYKLLNPSVKVGEEECWLIEVKPATPKEKTETGYARSEAWVSKSKLMVVQSKSYLGDGQRVKYTQFRNIQRISGVWTALEIIARTVKGSDAVSTTVITLSDVKYNQPTVTEADFTERRLEQGL